MHLSFQALCDRNKIWGILFTGLNQDGHTSSPITSPSGEQQQKLMESVYIRSGISPHSVQYIEAHGKYFRFSTKKKRHGDAHTHDLT